MNIRETLCLLEQGEKSLIQSLRQHADIDTVVALVEFSTRYSAEAWILVTCGKMMFCVSKLLFHEKSERRVMPCVCEESSTVVLSFHPICPLTSLDANSRIRTLLMTQFSTNSLTSPFLQYTNTSCLGTI